MPVKVYDGTNWVTVAGDGQQGAASSSSIVTWVKTASGGETSLSGNDDNSQPLSYTAGQELVYINGVLQKRAVDYVATTGTTITGLNALTASDVVTVWTVNAFSVTNAIPNSTITAKGNLIVGTGSGTYTAQAVGTDGQMLTANSAQADGVEWTTPASMTLLSTTTLSGTSTSVTVAANTYKNLVAYIYGVNVASGNFNANVRINSITAATYTNFNSSCVPAGTITNTGGDTSAIDLNQPGTVSIASGALNAWNLTFWDCNSTQKKNVTVNGSYINMNAVNNIMQNRVSVTAATSAITNITVISGTSITAGTIEIYGEK